MRRLLGLTLATLMLSALGASAEVGLQKLTLDPALDAHEPQVRILTEDRSTLRLKMRLPSLDLEELVVDGQVFQSLTLAGGGLRGEHGQAALPTITRMVAIPADLGVSARVLDEENRVMPGFRVMPLQPDGAESFVMDRAYYSRAQSLSRPAVEVGDPAILRDLRVVPVTFSPVSYDPVSGEITVSTRLEVELSFVGRDLRNSSHRQRDLIPESFDRMYRDLVLNYDSFLDRSEAQVGLGTYLIIAPSSVTSHLQPLLDWRKRQGYNVIHATTGDTGGTNNAIKNYIQNIYDTVSPPLEFVVLAGDANGSYPVPCWYENLSNYGGEGDHYYSTLEGGDILSDVHVGRLSYRDTGTLQTIVNKILAYETAPPTGDSGWFTRACLTGDPGASGITTIYVNQWVKTQLIKANYTQIDTIWSGNFTSQMIGKINQGLTIFGYRGYWQMSGMSSDHINGLDNGDELPFALIPTCGTGSFADDSNARSEAFLRAPNGGGIGAVGTATTGTHTRFNNCYYTATFDAAINGSDRRQGVAHTFGKTAIWLNYQHDTYWGGDVPEIWAMWNTLMGDPATELRSAYPANLNAVHPSSLPLGVNSVPVTVTGGAGAVEGALVCLYKAGDLQVSGYTDFGGRVNLPIAGYSSGELLVTVTKLNHVPYQGSLTLGVAGVFAAYHDSDVDDDSTGDSAGNNNGRVNPGESIELPVALRNLGNTTATDVTAILSTRDLYATVTDGDEDFGNMSAGAIVWSAEDFDFDVALHAPDGHTINLDLVASSLFNEWTSLIQLQVESAAFTIEDFSWAGGSTLDPGESGSFSVQLRNTGSITGSNVTALLETDSPWISINDANGSYGTMAVNGTAENTSNPFSMAIASDCFEGHLATFTLTLTFNGQAQASVEFALPVGSAGSNDPVGPDAYGYYAFDNTDTGYPFAPTYNWIEIDPNYGGQGTDLGLSDFGWEQDDVEIEDLPFTFTYYGQDYDQISICSNGFVAMGQTYLKPYTNWALPGQGGPDAMIAPMWENLYQTGSNKVYTWNDVENHRYVVQWSRLRNDYSNATQNFELVLYDPGFYPTASGDGQILFQYATVNNTDSRDGYVTVGIQNEDHSDGLLYTYWNRYALGAATLSAGRAILILPATSMIVGHLEGDVTNASNGNSPLAGVDIQVLELNQTLVSGGDGHYFGSVQEGSYTVRAEHYSFEPVTVTGVEILEDQTTLLDFALTDILAPEILNTTVHPYTSDTVGPYVVETLITDFSAITEKHCYYKVNGGGQYEAPLTLVDAETGLHRAEIPGYPLNTQINYWIEAEDVVGLVSRDPEGEGTYEFWVLGTVTVLADDMETDGGWTVGDAGDDASTGIWVRVDPNGVSEGGDQIQPEDDASPPPGVMCYITGNDPPGSNQGADDVDGGKTTLLSPWFDLSEVLAVQVSYRRWYTNDTGSSPGQDFWVVQATDDGSNWVDLENTNQSDRSWAYQTFNLSDYVDLTSTVRLRFIASDEGDGSVVEAGVDEFLLVGFQEPNDTGVDETTPLALTLLPNVPNPFNPATEVRFGLPSAQSVSLSVYEATGRLVRELLADRPLEAGFHSVQWNGRDQGGAGASSGIYFYVLETETERLSGKMTLLK